ncbi:NAD(P)-binding protein [Punctularia strigosozonata HHB-11173 SS5]|uniref:NAD(P)-binding protein n=1 Tax=Punctularia strigosozonata (strain HHB-11173) TaxID=741275 RepID=UPI00044162B9|nr:NAD(P)-binding protein [Punctularia strigosozonata HHB-11173 SS5]EIN06047.1 NAD(P)-binding protein [Punctularia strigosozonata HHB-11173 SS5]
MNTLGITRPFSTSCRVLANRAIVYSANGEPSSVLGTTTFPTLPSPPPGAVNVRFRLSPINPADVNVVEGKYPAKPAPSALSKEGSPVFVGGNEGLAEVSSVGQGVTGLSVGDWVVMNKPQSGTWTSSATAREGDVLKIPKTISEVHAATLTVNPPTALCMLTDFVDLQPGDWVIQNAANSAVGQSVIQIAASKGINTLNFIRARSDLDSTKEWLKEMGATHVFTYDDVQDKTQFASIKKLVAEKKPRLLLNATCDPTLGRLAGLLDKGGHLVTYGAMAKQPFSVPPGLFIFNKLTCHGFWMSTWANEKGKDKSQLLLDIVKLVEQGKLREPEHEIITLRKNDGDDQLSNEVREIFAKMKEGQGKKVLLRIEEPDD